MARKRRQFTPEQKVRILREHLIDGDAVSDVCDRHDLQPSVFYDWQRKLFEGGAAALSHKRGDPEKARLERRVEKLEARDRPQGRGDRRGNRGVCEAKKRAWGALNGRWVPHDARDEVIDFVRTWSTKTELPARRFTGWLGIREGKFYDWKRRYGQVNEHNAWIPRDHWLEDWEKEAIVEFARQHPGEGYRRLTFMMLDYDVVAVSPTSTYRVLKRAGLLGRWNKRTTTKGDGFQQPDRPHEHWHVDIAYLNICGTFYYLITVLDGCSRYIIHWEIRESMREADVEIVLQRARERFPGVHPRIITDNGSQFIARDFQGVHPHQWHVARSNVAVLPAVQRQDRALASDREGRGRAPQHPAVHPRCAQGRRRLRRALLHRPAAQRDRLRDARGPAPGAPPPAVRGAGRQARGRARGTASGASSGSRAAAISQSTARSPAPASFLAFNPRKAGSCVANPTMRMILSPIRRPPLSASPRTSVQAEPRQPRSSDRTALRGSRHSIADGVPRAPHRTREREEQLTRSA